MKISTKHEFNPVKASLADLIGQDRLDAVCHARAALTGEDLAGLLALANERVDFLPANFMARQHALLDQVGKRVAGPLPGVSVRGASTKMFEFATKTEMAPLSALGLFRVGEDGRLYLITKSEHYHAPLGHGFPGYALLERARQLGTPNATHNNTRGQITRLLEEELVRAAHGVSPGDLAQLEQIAKSNDPFICNRVLNLETGSLAVEAALKMILARFYRVESSYPAPKYAGHTPVLLVMGNDDGGFQANYHGTTVLLQLVRGMWPELSAGMEKAGLCRVCPVRPNNIADLNEAFARWEGDGHKIAGFFHEIVMMNYGARLLSREFLQHAYALCRQHDVPTVVDEIQSCLWHHDFFLFREWSLKPSFVAIGKGFPGGEYPASRLIFSAAMDTLPQFGALVTNGQEELASLAYLVTMRWSRENAQLTRSVGDYYAERVREFAAAHPDQIAAVEGKRHLTALAFNELVTAKEFARQLNVRGLDISAQTYKQDCPPSVLTKIPLIATPAVVDFVLRCFEEALA